MARTRRSNHCCCKWLAGTRRSLGWRVHWLWWHLPQPPHKSRACPPGTCCRRWPWRKWPVGRGCTPDKTRRQQHSLHTPPGRPRTSWSLRTGQAGMRCSRLLRPRSPGLRRTGCTRCCSGRLCRSPAHTLCRLLRQPMPGTTRAHTGRTHRTSCCCCCWRKNRLYNRCSWCCPVRRSLCQPGRCCTTGSQQRCCRCPPHTACMTWQRLHSGSIRPDTLRMARRSCQATSLLKQQLERLLQQLERSSQARTRCILWLLCFHSTALPCICCKKRPLLHC